MTDTEVANLALSHLNISAPIGNLWSERSQEANSIRPYYKIVRDMVLRDFEWPFASKFVNLALVSDCLNNSEGYRYSYRYPSECVKLRRLLHHRNNGGLNSYGYPLGEERRRDKKIPYIIISDTEGQLILCNVPCAKAEITWEPPTVSFPPDFYMAQSYRLAAYIAKTLTGGDPYKLGESAAQMYMAEVKKAQANSANEEQKEKAPQPVLINAREGGYGGPGGYEGTDF